MAAPASLAEALAALQAQMPRVTKKHDAEVTSQRTGKTFKYDYADLTDVTEALYPVMAPLGLSFISMPTAFGSPFQLHYILRHVSGESVEGFYPLPDPEKVGPQDLGKAITYARRYALCAVTGLAPGGDDDDAQGAQDAARSRSLPAAQRKPRTVPDAQLAAEGRMTRAQLAEHKHLEADTKDPRGQRADRSRPKAPDPADPWTTDHADYVTGQRAEEIRTEQIFGPDSPPEDKPGSMTESQHRAIERMLGFIGCNSREERHGMVIGLLNLPDLESMNDLSFAQAAALLPRLNDEAARIRAEATANAT